MHRSHPHPRVQLHADRPGPEISSRNIWNFVMPDAMSSAMWLSLPRFLHSLTPVSCGVSLYLQFQSTVLSTTVRLYFWLILYELYEYMHVYNYIYIHIFLDIHTYIDTYIHTHIHTYTYIYRLDICELRTKNVLISSNDVLCDSANITTGSADYSRGASGQIETMHMACASSRAALAALS